MVIEVPAPGTDTGAIVAVTIGLSLKQAQDEDAGIEPAPAASSVEDDAGSFEEIFEKND